MSDINISAEYFNGTISRDFFHLVCGKKLGFGVYRAVYENKLDPDTVFKFEYGTNGFCNAKEWQLWNEMEYMSKDVKKWFAPCVAISPCGNVLVQKRTFKREPAAYPDKIPKHFGDTKYDNFGFIGKQLVCHDYGNFIITNGLNNRLVKANWWE